jgi:hypothetical protein
MPVKKRLTSNHSNGGEMSPPLSFYVLLTHIFLLVAALQGVKANPSSALM